MTEEEIEDLLEIGCCHYHMEVGEKANKEIKKLHSIIKEVRKCINDFAIEEVDYSKIYSVEERAILKILDKLGSDKE